MRSWWALKMMSSASGMSFHCRDGCSIPKSSGHEEETDGFDAGGAFSWGAFGCGS